MTWRVPKSARFVTRSFYDALLLSVSLCNSLCNLSSEYLTFNSKTSFSSCKFSQTSCKPSQTSSKFPHRSLYTSSLKSRQSLYLFIETFTELCRDFGKSQIIAGNYFQISVFCRDFQKIFMTFAEFCKEGMDMWEPDGKITYRCTSFRNTGRPVRKLSVDPS